VNISGIFILFAHWSDCVDRNDKVFTFVIKILIYKIVMHKKVSHPDEIQNIIIYVYVEFQDTFFVSNNTFEGNGYRYEGNF
jgi:hypothetical protein